MLYRDSQKNKMNSLAKSKLFDTIVRRSVEISDDHPNVKNFIPLLRNYHEQRL